MIRPDRCPGVRRCSHLRRATELGANLRYITNDGPAKGALLRHDVAGTIDVLEALDGAAPVGTAFCTGANLAGVALWRLSIRGRDAPGACVVLHRSFRSA